MVRGAGRRGFECVTKQILSLPHKISHVLIYIFPGLGKVIDFSEPRSSKGGKKMNSIEWNFKMYIAVSFISYMKRTEFLLRSNLKRCLTYF